MTYTINYNGKAHVVIAQNQEDVLRQVLPPENVIYPVQYEKRKIEEEKIEVDIVKEVKKKHNNKRKASK